MPPTATSATSARGKPPDSMLKTLTRLAKSSWANEMGMATTAPSPAILAAAMRLVVTS